MIIVLNGFPGVGKLTIGRELAERLGGRLLDAHTVYNLSFALTDFKSDVFYDTIRAVWQIADQRIGELPNNTPLVLTEVLLDGSAWAEESWSRILKLADTRGPLFVVHISCEEAENARRIQSEDRDKKRKPRDIEMVTRYHKKAEHLMGRDTARFLALDTTQHSSIEAAEKIHKWICAVRPESRCL